MILLKGLTSTVVLVFTFAERTRPSLRLTCTSRTRPSGQEERGVFSSRINTISLTIKFLCSFVHFSCCCSDGRYSRVQRLQKTFARYWTCRQRLFSQLSFFEKTPGGTFGLLRNSRRWLGVRGSMLLGSSDNFVRGRPSR